MIPRGVKQELYEIVVIPTVVYVSESRSLSAQGRRKIKVFEKICLRNICGIKRDGRVRKSIIIREKCVCGFVCTTMNLEECVKIDLACGKNGGGKVM